MQTGDSGEREDPAETTVTVIRGRECVIEFVHHAVDRMRARGITVEMVLRCLKTPDERNLPADGGRERVGRHDADRRRLDVVFERTRGQDGSPDTIIVVSAMWATRGR